MVKLSLGGGRGWAVSLSLSGFLKPTLRACQALGSGSRLTGSHTGESLRSSRPDAQKGCSLQSPCSQDSPFGDSNAEVLVPDPGPLRPNQASWLQVTKSPTQNGDVPGIERLAAKKRERSEQWSKQDRGLFFYFCSHIKGWRARAAVVFS